MTVGRSGTIPVDEDSMMAYEHQNRHSVLPDFTERGSWSREDKLTVERGIETFNILELVYHGLASLF